MSICSAPVRTYLPKLIDLVFKGTINPGKVIDLALPLAQVAEGFRAMDAATVGSSQGRRVLTSDN